MFGYTAEEMIGQSILRIVPDSLHYEEDEILQKLRSGERIDHYETRRQKKNNDLIDVSVTISPIRDSTGAVMGASKIARDISDRKRIEKLLIQNEKAGGYGSYGGLYRSRDQQSSRIRGQSDILARQDSAK